MNEKRTELNDLSMEIADLEFTPVSADEAAELDDRAYLLGVAEQPDGTIY